MYTVGMNGRAYRRTRHTLWAPWASSPWSRSPSCSGTRMPGSGSTPPFALGEIGAPAACAVVPDLVELLEHERHQVARAGLDAMAYIGVNTRAALPAIRKLLTVEHPTWQSLDGERWTGENQARFNAMCALLNSDIPVEELDDLMIHCLDDDTAYVHALALEALTRPRQWRGPPGAAAFAPLPESASLGSHAGTRQTDLLSCGQCGADALMAAAKSRSDHDVDRCPHVVVVYLHQADRL